MSTAIKQYYVYVLFRENGIPFYIGKGKGSRWMEHEQLARVGMRGHRYNLIRHMLGRGVEVPKIKLHEGLSEAVAHSYEVALIAAIGRHPLGPLLNLTDGGEGASGRRHTEETRARMRLREISAETRAKISRAAKARKLPKDSPFPTCWVGRKHSAKAIEKLRNRVFTPEHRAKLRKPKPPGFGARIAAAKLGKPLSLETRAKLRKPKSAEHRAKLRLAALRRLKPPKAGQQLTLDL